MSNTMPFSGFHFSVAFELLPQFSIDTKFQSVSGLTSTIETESINEGDQNRFKISLPKGNNFDDLVLKRGVTSDFSGLRMWINNALQNFVFVPANLLIMLLNEQHDPIKVWYVTKAIPKSLSVSDFDAENNNLVIETLTLDYQFFNEIPIP